MHRTWNPWWHLGSTRTFSPSANSPRHMGHSVAGGISAPSPYTATGMRRSARRLSPVAASRAATSSGVSNASRRPHRSAHRTIELSPSAKMSAHSSAASMMTMLVSKLALLPATATWAGPVQLAPGGASEKAPRCLSLSTLISPSARCSTKWGRIENHQLCCKFHLARNLKTTEILEVASAHPQKEYRR